MEHDSYFLDAEAICPDIDPCGFDIAHSCVMDLGPGFFVVIDPNQPDVIGIGYGLTKVVNGMCTIIIGLVKDGKLLTAHATHGLLPDVISSNVEIKDDEIVNARTIGVELTSAHLYKPVDTDMDFDDIVETMFDVVCQFEQQQVD